MAWNHSWADYKHFVYEMKNSNHSDLSSLIREKTVLVFDFDGVIADSVEVKTLAFADIYSEYGDKVVNSVMSHHQANGGMSRFDKFRHYHHEYIGVNISSKDVDILSARFSKMVVDEVIASLGIAGAELFLKKHYKNKKCYVNSATPQKEIKHIIHKRNLKPYFEDVFGSPESKSVNLTKIIELNPDKKLSDFIFFGDAMSDFNAANQCGVAFVGVASSDVSALISKVPNELLIKNFNDLLTC